jgi:hypothetical protein
LRGNKESFQVFSLPGQDHLEFRAAGPAFSSGEADYHRWLPTGVQGRAHTCMMLTFLSLAQTRGLTPAEYESEAEGLVEDIDGKYSFTEVTVRPQITVKSEAELEPTREVIESAEAHCFISNSVKAKVAAELVVALPPK